MPLTTHSATRVKHRLVWVPPDPDKHSSSWLNLSKILYSKLCTKYRCLYLADKIRQFDPLEQLGPTVLVCPDPSDLPQYALQQASGVISFCEATARVAKALGTPHLLVSPETHPCSLAVLERELAIWLETLSLPTELGSRTARHVLQSSPEVYCAISDQNFLPQLLGWLKNLQPLSPKAQFHILCLQPGVQKIAQSSFATLDLRFYTLEDIWPKNALGTLYQRERALQAYSSKAKLIQKALKIARRPVLYSDTDIFFFRSPKRFLPWLEKHSLLLFPHWQDHIEDTAQYGLFNAGLIGVSYQPEAETFLEWWAQRCLETCTRNTKNTYFVDQGYLDLAPLYFPNTAIYRNKDENLGPWNRNSLATELRWENGALTAVRTDGIRVGSFHTSQPDPGGIFDYKCRWDQLATFFSTAPEALENTPWVWRLLQQQMKYSHKLQIVINSLNFLKHSLRPLFFVPKQKMVAGLLMPPLPWFLATIRKLRTLVRSDVRNPNRPPSPSPHPVSNDRKTKVSQYRQKTKQPMAIFQPRNTHELRYPL